MVAFLDSFREGTFLGQAMHRPESFFTSAPPVDLFIVASHLWANEMLETLANYGANPVSVSLTVQKERYAYLFLNQGAYEKEEREVEAVFTDEGDRSLWRTIMKCARSHDLSDMARWYIENPGIPYMHQVALKEGCVVVEGGVFDGSNTVEFAGRIGKTGRVYGFDP